MTLPVRKWWRSWWGVLNVLVLQWFFCRLAAQLELVYDDMGCLTEARVVGWKLYHGIVPLTGWGQRPYRWLWRGGVQ